MFGPTVIISEYSIFSIIIMSLFKFYSNLSGYSQQPEGNTQVGVGSRRRRPERYLGFPSSNAALLYAATVFRALQQFSNEKYY